MSSGLVWWARRAFRYQERFTSSGKSRKRGMQGMDGQIGFSRPYPSGLYEGYESQKHQQSVVTNMKYVCFCCLRPNAQAFSGHAQIHEGGQWDPCAQIHCRCRGGYLGNVVLPKLEQLRAPMSMRGHSLDRIGGLSVTIASRISFRYGEQMLAKMTREGRGAGGMCKGSTAGGWIQHPQSDTCQHGTLRFG